jgi:4-amino-4-deoxy-L-arabinose transferase-like glycosyltransferase
MERRWNAERRDGARPVAQAKVDLPSAAAAEASEAPAGRLRSADVIRLAVYLTIGLAIRLILTRYQYVINTDGVYYAWLGRRLVSWQPATGLSTYWPPFYPFLVGLASLWVRDLEFAGRLVSVVCGTLLIVPAYVLVRESYGRRAASLAALLVVVYPELTEVSTLVMTEATYTLLLTSAVVVTWHAARSRGTTSALLSGLLFGLAYLTRPEALCYAPLVLAMLWAAVLVRDGPPLAIVLRKTVLFTLAVGVCAAPYIAFLHHQTGRWTISQKLGHNAQLGSTHQSILRLTEDGQATTMDLLYGDAFQEGTTPPLRLSASAPTQETIVSPSEGFDRFTRLALALKAELQSFVPQMFPPLFMAVALIGLMGQPWGARRFARELYLALFVAASLAGYALAVLEVRYLVPVLPILLGWVAKGILELESWSTRTASKLGVRFPGGRRSASVAVLVLLIASRLASLTYPGRVSPWQDLPLEQRIAGLWIRDRGPREPLIMAAGPWAAYYADGRHLYLPQETPPTVLDYARRKGIDYLIVDERSRSRYPSLMSLLDSRELPLGLRVAYENRDELGYALRVFELTHAGEAIPAAPEARPPVAP